MHFQIAIDMMLLKAHKGWSFEEETQPVGQLLNLENACFATYQNVSISHEFNFTQTRNNSVATFVKKEKKVHFLHLLFFLIPFICWWCFPLFFCTYAPFFHFIIALTFYCMLTGRHSNKPESWMQQINQ